jgi:threonine/homoserine/homoserine lactone efflux protein
VGHFRWQEPEGRPAPDIWPCLIIISIVPQFIRAGDTPLRLVLMLLAFEVLILAWLNLYGYLVSRAGQSRAGASVRRVLERVTGVVLIALGVRLVLQRRL